jgi:tRNA(adenine34) deaminase
MGNKNNDIHFMKKAIHCASIALEQGNFPVGCVITYQNNIISTGSRTSSVGHSPNELDHAEINALKNLGSQKEISHLNCNQLTLYSTLEPCLMCFGAILIHRIPRIVYAYEDVMGGGTSLDRSDLSPLYASQDIEIVPGVCRQDSLYLFKDFFSNPKNNYLSGSYLATYTIQQLN